MVDNSFDILDWKWYLFIFLYYNEKKKGEKIFNRIELRSPIIPEVDFLYTGLKEKELDNGKSNYFIILLTATTYK